MGAALVELRWERTPSSHCWGGGLQGVVCRRRAGHVRSRSVPLRAGLGTRAAEGAFQIFFLNPFKPVVLPIFVARMYEESKHNILEFSALAESCAVLNYAQTFFVPQGLQGSAAWRPAQTQAVAAQPGLWSQGTPRSRETEPQPGAGMGREGRQAGKACKAASSEALSEKFTVRKDGAGGRILSFAE